MDTGFRFGRASQGDRLPIMSCHNLTLGAATAVFSELLDITVTATGDAHAPYPESCISSYLGLLTMHCSRLPLAFSAVPNTSRVRKYLTLLHSAVLPNTDPVPQPSPHQHSYLKALPRENMSAYVMKTTTARFCESGGYPNIPTSAT